MGKNIEIKTKKAPQAVGPYAQAIKVGNLIFCSGQIALDPQTNQLVEGGIESQTKQVLNNLSQILKAAGVNLSDVVKTEIFLTKISDFQVVNEIYGTYFTNNPKPARQTVEVSNLPKGALIEISCIAYE